MSAIAYPTAPVDGQQFTDATGVVWVWKVSGDSGKWGRAALEGTGVIPAGYTSAYIGDTAPAFPAQGLLWFNSDTGELLFRYDETWLQPAALSTITWTNVANRPTTFAPSAHTQAPSTLTAGGATSVGQTLEWNGTNAWVPASAGVKILAAASAPPAPTTRDYAWYDTGNHILSFWDIPNAAWVATNAVAST